MERLTKYSESQCEYIIDCKCESCDTCKENILALCSMQDKVIQKCGEYENTGLTPQGVEKLINENAELKLKLEKTTKFPCKIGSMVYSIKRQEILECEVIGFNITHELEHNGESVFIREKVLTSSENNLYTFDFYDFNKTVFPTREEAEQVLKESELNG